MDAPFISIRTPMNDDIHKDVQIHIHEHVGPIRERLGKIEGRMETHDRELTLLRQGLEQLRERIDSTRDAVLQSVELHAKASMSMFDAHQKIDFEKDDDISKRLAEVQIAHADVLQQVRSTQSWVKAIGIGASAVAIGLTLLERLGVFAAHLPTP